MTNNEEHDVERLYRQHFAELDRHGLNLCGDEELVKDCIQDFFAHLLAGQSLLSRVDNMRSYLFASIRHGLYAALDKQYRQDSLDADAPFDLQVTDEELARLFDRDDESLRMARRLRGAFRKLNANQRQAVYLRYVKGFSWDEIGMILHIAPHSCMNLVSRAVSKLRDLLSLSLLGLFLGDAWMFPLFF